MLRCGAWSEGEKMGDVSSSLNFWFADNAGAMHALRRREAFERLLARSCHIPHRALSTAKRRTLYDTLGVQSTASDDEIRQARVLGGREEGEGLC
jgi:hypothetical protein